MPLVWVTGNSGAGKSTVCEILAERGEVALDADEHGSRWSHRTTGEDVGDAPEPVPSDWLTHHAWVIDRRKVVELAHHSRSHVTFLCGSVENESEVRDLFHLIVCLVIDDTTLRRRLATRTTNAFGRNPDEVSAALAWNPRMRPLYERLGAYIVDATRPACEVADEVTEVATTASLPR